MTTDLTGRLPGFPKDLSEIKEVQNTLKQSTSDVVNLVEDSNGVRYVLKRSKAEGHVKSEYEAYLFLRSCGVPVPEIEYYPSEEQGQDTLLVKYIPNLRPLRECLTGDVQKDKALASAVRDWLYAFILIGGWDMLGLQLNNAQVDENGNLIFIDFGCAFNYRANGFQKDGKIPALNYYKQEGVKEFETMIDSSQQTGIFYSLNGLTAEELRISLLSQANNVDLSKLKGLSDTNYNALKTRHEYVLGSTDSLKKYLPHFEATVKANNEALKRAEDNKCIIPLRDPPKFGMICYEIPAIVNWKGVIHEIDNETPNNDPLFEETPGTKAIQVSAIVKEMSIDSIWLEKDANGAYRLPTIDVVRDKDKVTGNDQPKVSLVWKAIMDLGGKVGQIGIKKGFVCDLENETSKRRVYLAERGGGNGGSSELKPLQEALQLVAKQDKDVLIAYARSANIQVPGNDPVDEAGITNISPV